MNQGGEVNGFKAVSLLTRKKQKLIDESLDALRSSEHSGQAGLLLVLDAGRSGGQGVRELSANALGLGDRSGSASLEEVLLSLLIFFNCDLGFQYDKLYSLSELIQNIVGSRINPLKPIIGDNCFNLVAGSQVNLAKDDIFAITPFLPEVVGQRLRVSLGAFSGAASVKAKLKEIGVTIEEAKIPSIVQKVKELAIRKRGEVNIEDLRQIISKV